MDSIRPRLTRRERDIASALVSGASNQKIAGALGLTEQTVKNRLSSMYRKVGVNSRLELALLLVRENATAPP